MTTPTPAQMAAEVLRLSEAATLGPWEVQDDGETAEGDHGWAMVQSDPDDNVIFDCTWVAYEGGGTPPRDTDAQFIAYTRTAAPAIAQALLDALERLAAVEAERDALVAALRQADIDVIRFLLDAHDARTKGEQV